MWTVTGWAVAMWARWTVVLAIAVGCAWWWLPAASLGFWAVVAGAVLGEWYLVRQLGREWFAEARYRWWWSR